MNVKAIQWTSFEVIVDLGNLISIISEALVATCLPSAIAWSALSVSMQAPRRWIHSEIQVPPQPLLPDFPHLSPWMVSNDLDTRFCLPKTCVVLKAFEYAATKREIGAYLRLRRASDVLDTNRTRSKTPQGSKDLCRPNIPKSGMRESVCPCLLAN